MISLTLSLDANESTVLIDKLTWTAVSEIFLTKCHLVLPNKTKY